VAPASEPLDTDQDRQRKFRRAGVVAIGVVTAVVARVALFGHESFDYRFFFEDWYEFISTHGGFSALEHDFSDYNVPYLYLITLLTYLPIPALAGIKLISVAFDLVLAYFTYRIVALRHPGSRWPPVAALIVLFLPTVATNSGMWAQADSIYAAFGLGGLSFLLRRRPWWAAVFFGLSLAFKLQAVFLPISTCFSRQRIRPRSTTGREAWPATGLLPAESRCPAGHPLPNSGSSPRSWRSPQCCGRPSVSSGTNPATTSEIHPLRSVNHRHRAEIRSSHPGGNRRTLGGRGHSPPSRAEG
jgi:hypothetical protein